MSKEEELALARKILSDRSWAWAERELEFALKTPELNEQVLEVLRSEAASSDFYHLLVGLREHIKTVRLNDQNDELKRALEKVGGFVALCHVGETGWRPKK